MWIYYMVFDIHLHGIQSLKEKRGMVKRLKARISRHNASVCESAAADSHQQMIISVVGLANSRKQGDGIMEAIEREVEREHFDYRLIERNYI